MISPDLLAILCCPKCHGDLSYNAQAQTLTCTSCGAVYPIKDDIPIMLVDERPTDPSRNV
jgi:uncharacterized protein YbaR (Trm112 family)